MKEDIIRPRTSSLKVAMVVLLLVAAALAFLFLRPSPSSDLVLVRYGITPYQDSALPVVAEEFGWYEEAGIDVEFIPLAWGDVMTALSSGSIDAVIYNFNSFQAPYANAVRASHTPLFYAPTFVFKGQAIMVNPGEGLELTGDSESYSQDERATSVARIASQLAGMRVAITEGTELEQIVLEALDKGGLTVDDVTLINASPEDGLAAFLSGDVDAFAAGLTERTEARRRGAVELLVTADVTLPVIDGIVTTEQFAEENEETLDDLVQIWFNTIRYMEPDVGGRSDIIRSYLSSTASTNFSPEEYVTAWTFNVFPDSASEASRIFLDSASPYFWRTSWDEVNEFLISEEQAASPVPYEAFLGEDVLRRLPDNIVLD